MNYFRSRKKTGPDTLNGEYFSIMRMRSFVRLNFGISSAWKSVGVLRRLHFVFSRRFAKFLR
jgi:hypothetical protein